MAEQAPIGKMPIGKSPIGKSPIGKAPGPVVSALLYAQNVCVSGRQSRGTA